MGLDTTIGHISKQIPWTDVENVDSQDGALIIQGRNKNAFIVPARAFKTYEAKEEFRDFVASRVDANGS
ncbi:YcxB family protein [Novosphingobium sp. P6W]|uniref:YcxB family protein n=1 Tax=Novosphingobium sp. P6W TaxID=1609758 RepID=UPI0013B468BA|nr:YcxB family protein [Novosphingobium sp. P6W]